MFLEPWFISGTYSGSSPRAVTRETGKGQGDVCGEKGRAWLKGGMVSVNTTMVLNLPFNIVPHVVGTPDHKIIFDATS